MTRRRFGKMRKLPSGRWQASFIGPDGIRRPAPHTFSGKGDVERMHVITYKAVKGAPPDIVRFDFLWADVK